MAIIVRLSLFILCMLLILAIGSALFRAAVALANRTIGPLKPKSSHAWDWDEDDDSDLDLPPRNSPALPEPGIGQGMSILLAVCLFHLVVAFVVENLLLHDHTGRRGGIDDWLPPYLLGLVAGFGVMTGIVAWMLPTTGRRAALATLYFHLIAVALPTAVTVIVYFISG